MFSNYHYAYLIGDLIIGLPVWILFFYYRKDLRREMIIAGILLGLISVFSEPWYSKDYWHPENLDLIRRGLGDFFYGFFPGGVACVIYEGVFRKYIAKRKNLQHKWWWFLLPLLLIGGLIFDIPTHFGMNSMHTTAIALLLITAIIVYFRRDLLWDSIFSGILFLSLSFAGYLVFFSLYPGIINEWWLLKWQSVNAGPSGVLIVGIPMEELLFAFTLGLAMGPMYEFLIGAKFTKKKNSSI
jgi:hypothetical protein